VSVYQNVLLCVGPEPTAIEVLRKINNILSLGDLCYSVREQESEGWEEPNVKQ
jgi:hypothetical protein